ncbi:uncharacterized protein EV422DRAFT_508460 [Fimicolochytrium jonesii]|uniref:uncharacterized protein n=1 Tax=Fimicolochytrium jonesii TaxID=1396493 RepID=UPI0022FE6BAC|nr:uncharacterized protein EV422DRAFT_508460 [Fimicolochytrium jonesii]KAI8817899.1 hypothetical protein EV422DRAFT_508460 [Fimicolochytrium jonesii]
MADTPVSSALLSRQESSPPDPYKMHDPWAGIGATFGDSVPAAPAVETVEGMWAEAESDPWKTFYEEEQSASSTDADNDELCAEYSPKRRLEQTKAVQGALQSEFSGVGQVAAAAELFGAEDATPQTPHNSYSRSFSESPLRKRSLDVCDRQRMIAAIGPAPPLIVTEEAPNAGPIPPNVRPDHVPLRKLSFGKDSGGPTTVGGTTNHVASNVHTILKTDTLAGIAIQYDITVTALKKANRLWHEDEIRFREHVVIPSLTGSSSPLKPIQLSPSRSAKTAHQKLRTVAENQPAESTEDLLKQIDADLVSALNDLGHEHPWRVGEKHVDRVGRVHTLGDWDSVLDASAADLRRGVRNSGGKAKEVRRGQMGSLEKVLVGERRYHQAHVPSPTTGSGGGSLGKLNDWVSQKLNSIIPTGKEEYAYLSPTDPDSGFSSSIGTPTTVRSRTATRTSYFD